MRKLSLIALGAAAAMVFATAANAELFRLKCSGYGGEMTISSVPKPDMPVWADLCGQRYYWSQYTEDNIGRYCPGEWMIKEFNSSKTVCTGSNG